MNIQDALKPTGKATAISGNWYAALNKDGVLFYYPEDSESGIDKGPVTLQSIQDLTWRPYYDKSVIRPEKGGEHWINEHGKHLFSYRMSLPIHWIDESGEVIDINLHNSIIHNQSGWTRLYPPVEDDNVERIEIKIEVGFPNRPGDHKSEYKFLLPDGYLKRIVNETLILEIPKEKSNV